MLHKISTISLLLAVGPLSTSCDDQASDPYARVQTSASQDIWLAPGKTVASEGLSLAAGTNPSPQSQPAKLPIMEQTAAEVCQGTHFRDAKGEVLEGRKVCKVRPCAKSGDVDCQTTPTFPSVAKAAISVDKILVGTKIAGIEGRYVHPHAPSCDDSGMQNCTSTHLVRPILKTLMVPGNFRKGIPIGPYIKGDYPSATYPLTGQVASSVALTPDNIKTAIGSSNRYHFWKADGTPVTLTGDARFAKQNIYLGTTVYDLPGNAPKKPARPCATEGDTGCEIRTGWLALKAGDLSADQIKNGERIGKITGTYPSVYNPLAGASASVPDLDLSTNRHLTSAASFEFWDANGNRHIKQGDKNLVRANIRKDVTVWSVAGNFEGYDPKGISRHDLRYNILMPNDTKYDGYLSPNIWCNTKQVCLDSYWRDVSPKAHNSGKFCSPDSKTCVYRTLLQGLDWAFPLDEAKKDWQTTAEYCRDLNLSGKTNWRLPSQKEAMQTVAHGFINLDIFKAEYFKVAGSAPTIWTSTAHYIAGQNDTKRFVYESAKDAFSSMQVSTKNAPTCVRSLEPQEAIEARREKTQ